MRPSPLPSAVLALALTGCSLIKDVDRATPSVIVLAPLDGDVGVLGDILSIQAEVEDGQDPLVRVSLRVSSDLDGELCLQVPGVTGEVSCSALLSEGVHTLSFLATDRAGKASDPVSVTVFIGALDGDGDGSPAGEDCDDTDDTVYPGAVELCDSIDNDCDGFIDEYPVDTIPSYRDADGDGYGIDIDTIDSCEVPSGYALEAGDCDDTDDTISPAAAEVYDGLDNNCDGTVDEGADTDDDKDGFSEIDGDCDDTNPDAFPGAPELCDGADNNCDGKIDEEAADAISSYRDADGDGYGTDTDTVTDCAVPSGYVLEAGDCDDTDDAISPDAIERTDTIDNDCDGDIDELDGEWSGTLSVTVAGSTEGSCTDAMVLIIDADAEPVIQGTGECLKGLFEAAEITGALSGEADAAGTLTATLVGSEPVSVEWIALIEADIFTGTFSGEVVGKKASWTYAGTMDLYR